MLDSENRKVNKYGFYKKKIEMISEIRSLSADCLPSLIKASVYGVSVSQFFGRSVAYFFHPLGLREKHMKKKLVLNMVRNKTASSFFF
ncbi:hypothetical protein AM233_06880 [Bacillus sp. FJAT-22058]|nr:hypothetical protein AM233_06880 [Bacillus sp. FJAT-22058]